MDFSQYSQEFQTLHHQHQAYLQVADKRVMTVLEEMLHEALKTENPELIGYVYHSMAFAEHFVMGRYKNFLKYLSLSATYLLRAKDPAEMMHIYYLVAIDSMNKGLNDIAAHYFYEARLIAEISHLETSAAVLDESIGHIIMQLGQYKEARPILQKGLAGIKKDKSHLHYYSNLSGNYMSDAFACLGMGNLKGAKASFRKVKSFIEKHPDKFRSDTYLNFELLRLRLALTEDNRAEAEESSRRLIALLKENTMLHLYIEEIKKLSDLMIEKECFPYLETILGVIEQNGISPDAVDALKILTGIKINYYTAKGDIPQLKKCYEEQNQVQQIMLTKQKGSRKYLAGLLNFTGQLRKEMEETMARQNMLLTMAKVDSLTDLANRYGANLKLDEAFEKAYQQQTTVGIVYMDMDNLKRVNDKLGHLEGDKHLQALAKSMKSLARKYDFFASRFGGDEFVLIFENQSDDHIRECIAELKAKCPVAFSSGCHNAVPYGKQKSWDFLEMADMELYKEKKQKKKTQ